MENNITNEGTEIFVEKVVKQVQEEMEENFRLAYIQMSTAEKKLEESLTEEQLSLYQNFCEKRERFYKKAKNIYAKRF